MFEVKCTEAYTEILSEFFCTNVMKYEIQGSLDSLFVKHHVVPRMYTNVTRGFICTGNNK